MGSAVTFSATRMYPLLEGVYELLTDALVPQRRPRAVELEVHNTRHIRKPGKLSALHIFRRNDTL